MVFVWNRNLVLKQGVVRSTGCRLELANNNHTSTSHKKQNNHATQQKQNHNKTKTSLLIVFVMVGVGLLNIPTHESLVSREELLVHRGLCEDFRMC